MWNTTAGKLFMTFLISMVPVLELRGALPIAQAHGLSQTLAIPVAIVGNLLPVPFIILFIRKIFTWIRHRFPRLDGFVTRLENRAVSKSDRVQKSLFWGLYLFVAVPLPGTGAWTGALIAAMLDIRLKRAFPAIAMGVVTAGLVIGLLSHGVGTLLG